MQIVDLASRTKTRRRRSCVRAGLALVLIVGFAASFGGACNRSGGTPSTKSKLTFSGVVKSRHDDAVADAEVQLVRVRGTKEAERIDPPTKSVRTDSSGNFKLEAEVGKSTWRLRVVHPDYATTDSELPTHEEDVRLVVECLAGRLRGVLQVDGGTPLGDLRVVAERGAKSIDEIVAAQNAESSASGPDRALAPHPPPTRLAAAILNANGEYEIDHVHAGDCRVRIVLAADNVEIARSNSILVRAGETAFCQPIDLRGKLAHINLTVVDSQHSPIARGIALAWPAGASGESPAVRLAFEHGKASLTLPFFPIDLEVRAEGHCTQHFEKVAHSSQVEMQPALPVCITLENLAELTLDGEVSVALVPLDERAPAALDSARALTSTGQIISLAGRANAEEARDQVLRERSAAAKGFSESGEVHVEVPALGRYRIVVRVSHDHADARDVATFEPKEIVVVDKTAEQRFELKLAREALQEALR